MSCPHCEKNGASGASSFSEEERKNGVRIALAGNPNCGKTTAFNAYTGAHQHVGNYPGVTVEKKEGWTRCGEQKVLLVDLPGAYSLTAYSMEERVVREVLAPENPAETPRAVIDVIDSATLERGLFLAVQIRELGRPVVLACNMMDEARKAGMSIDLEKLSARFGVRAVPTVARSGEGLDKALELALEEAAKPCEPLFLSYGPDIDPALLKMTSIIKDRHILTSRYPARWTALKILENDEVLRAQVKAADAAAALELDALRDTLAEHLAATLETTPEAVVSDFRYGFIHSALKDGVIRKDDTKDRLAFTDKLDKVLTNTVLGPLIMLGVVYFMFWTTFIVGAYPQGWVEDFFGMLGEFMSGILPEGLVQSLIVDGIIGGVGGVLSFVPLILIMFLIVSFLEDSGYMARMAYMLDRVMRAFGLHGSSVMPFIIAGGIAGGCAIPGVMATRTMRSEKERMATMMTLPLMTCGAKIPVFLMLTAAFFPENQAGIMFAVTLCGWAVALLVSLLLRKTVFRGASTPFVMELPPYRLPTLRSIITHTWERGWMYIKKAGTVILAISVILWAALTFPALDAEKAAPFEAKIAAFNEEIHPLEAQLAEVQKALESADDASRPALEQTAAGISAKKDALEEEKAEAENALASEQVKNTFGGRIGRFIEPVFRPLGFDWRTDVALISGVAAKEAILSTMGTAYSIGETDPDEPDSLSARLAADPDWSRTTALALMLFVLIYSPCFVTLVVLKNEAGGWRWLFFSMAFNTAVAYAVAWAGTLAGNMIWG
ncbi:ferrous iron transport protein B [Mailhella massiliensis]|uniref:Ferrous iron transport protein B n=1 Tax=Mailhella massiliensis TaxID=1903261 RepID=A0A921AX09_9BACT|nr:ferrous iron transport protein B [Mailhella massiliensis]HJD97875.1 ferrous iron transport protein B [Mailhella massiliensis]